MLHPNRKNHNTKNITNNINVNVTVPVPVPVPVILHNSQKHLQKDPQNKSQWDINRDSSYSDAQYSPHQQLHVSVSLWLLDTRLLTIFGHPHDR